MTFAGMYDVWPDNLKLYATYALLGAGAVGTGVSLVVLVGMVSQRMRWMTSKVGNVVGLVVSVVCVGVFVAVAVYYKLWDSGEACWHDLM